MKKLSRYFMAALVVAVLGLGLGAPIADMGGLEVQKAQAANASDGSSSGGDSETDTSVEPTSVSGAF